ncbi:MAG: hypothetical protein DWQ58_02920 [Microcystis aeruginosa TA09]|nr:MAG: hypothetical protein DWQ58_02920 [Microcystis aeruginosa TA09]
MRSPPSQPDQATAQPNPNGRQQNDTHSPPHKSIKSYNLINLYIPFPSLGIDRGRFPRTNQLID